MVVDKNCAACREALGALERRRASLVADVTRKDIKQIIDKDRDRPNLITLFVINSFIILLFAAIYFFARPYLLDLGIGFSSG